MFAISRLTVEHQDDGCVTDEAAPTFAYAVSGDAAGLSVRDAELTVGGWSARPDNQVAIRYGGGPLRPFTTYPVRLRVTSSEGDVAEAATSFETGRMGTPWVGQWISDPGYRFTGKKVSPRPMSFRKVVTVDAPVRRARLYATAMGMYRVAIDGVRVGSRHMAPGFTSYRTNLQYQTYDVTEAFAQGGGHTLLATVAGGWAVGSFVFTRVNRVSADRQALLAELRLEYADGRVETIGTDGTWEVTEDGPVTMADLYDGETYDARRAFGPDGSQGGARWHAAAPETLRVHPAIVADYGSPVTDHETFEPVGCTRRQDGELVYDFGQNFAGVVRLTLVGAKAGQTVTVRHAEILNPDGSLNTRFLRSAKATLTYTCADGDQTYAPEFTYMGFRYIGVTGADAGQLRVEGVARYSDVRRTGDFTCSDERLNQLQRNITWSAKSNFVDIPTDCPQRDERFGWTGDIAIFAPTACFDFDMTRFLAKWLKDVKAEQRRSGGIPCAVPAQGYGFPATMPPMAIDWWGDACVLVPWAMYQASGDDAPLRDMYPSMRRYLKACLWWAALGSFGRRRYIWHTPAALHFGDWVSPDAPKMSQWQGRSRWTATASINNTARTLARVARVLGHDDDARRYDEVADKVADAYCSVFTDGEGRLKEEFQTAYVLPLAQGMFPEAVRAKAADRLAGLVKANGWRVGTGFPGTPQVLFALADHGHLDEAYRMLLNEDCPGWLYEVKVGATTMWERWDGLDDHGECPIGDDGTGLMISYNHYAFGAVGAFLYRRVAGLEPLEAGYRRFRVRPLPGGGLTWANAHIDTPYGRAGVSWSITGDRLEVTVDVPVGATCELETPDGASRTLSSGTHTVTCAAPAAGARS